MRICTLVVLCVLLEATRSLQGQQRPAQTVQAALDDIAKRDWTGLSALIDSARLVEFRHENLGLIVEWARRKDEIAAAERAHGSIGFNGDSVTPATIAAVKNVRLPSFGLTVGRLAALSPQAFYERWTAAAHKDPDHPVFTWITAKRQIVGELTLGDTMAYVIYRRETRTLYDSVIYHYLPGAMEVAPLRHGPGRWKLLLHDDLEQRDAFWNVVPRAETHRWNLGKWRHDTCASLLIPPPPAHPARQSASAVVHSAFEALQHADWNALAALVHPMMLKHFKREQLNELIGWARERKHPQREVVSGITVVLHSPNEDTTATPDIADVADVHVPHFRDSVTIAELAAATPERFFALWAETMLAHPPLTETLDTFPPRRIIGEIAEGQSVAHVLYAGGPYLYTDRWRLTRMPLLRTEEGWGLLLNDDIGDGMALGFMLMMVDHPEVPDSAR